MKIQIEPHTLERAEERGANKSEIIDVITNGITSTAKMNRLAKFKVFDFNSLRNNKFYEQKRIEVIYTIENDTYVTITVYVFYGKWE